MAEPENQMRAAPSYLPAVQDPKEGCILQRVFDIWVAERDLISPIISLRLLSLCAGYLLFFGYLLSPTESRAQAYNRLV